MTSKWLSSTNMFEHSQQNSFHFSFICTENCKTRYHNNWQLKLVTQVPVAQPSEHKHTGCAKNNKENWLYCITVTDIFHHKSFPASKPACNCVTVAHQYAYQQIPFLKLTHAGICKCVVTQVIEVLKYIGERIGNKEWPLIRSKRSIKRRVSSAHTWVLLLLTYVRLGGGVELLFETGRWWVVFPRGSRGALKATRVEFLRSFLRRQPVTWTAADYFYSLSGLSSPGACWQASHILSALTQNTKQTPTWAKGRHTQARASICVQ